MINNIDNKLNICGIYKINYDNGKIYIGQARSIYTRALEHNSKNKYPCDKALKKDEVALCKKLLGTDTEDYYCIDCLAEYLECTKNDLEIKIQEFKEQGCTLFL